jgi:hypothetical protein
MEKTMRTLKSEELNLVAGAATDAPSSKDKGNNGWGNGIDTTNPGSPAGGTAESKLANPEGFPNGKFDGR